MPDDHNPDGDLTLGQTAIGPVTGRPDFSFGEAVSGRDLSKALLHAAIGANRETAQLLVTEALESGYSAETLADQYIPAVAEELGRLWTLDELTFVQVTIGTARLQALLRDLGPHWAGDRAAGPDAPTVLLVVHRDCQHTLGAMLAAGQLRRMGLSVRLLVGASYAEIKASLQHSKFDAFFISAATAASLDSSRRITEIAKDVGGPGLQVVVGGRLLVTHPDAARLIGADHGTIDPAEAVRLCGLNERPFRQTARPVRLRRV